MVVVSVTGLPWHTEAGVTVAVSVVGNLPTTSADVNTVVLEAQPGALAVRVYTAASSSSAALDITAVVIEVGLAMDDEPPVHE